MAFPSSYPVITPPTVDVTYNITSSIHVGNGTKATAPEGCLVIAFSLFTTVRNNPDDLISRKTQQAVSKFVNVYMLTILFFISFPTNIINMIVFWRHGLRERINLCLFCLAFSDLIIVAGHFGWNIDGVIAEMTGRPFKAVVFTFAVNHMIHGLAGFISVSGFLCTLIALERCLCVCNPLKAQSIVETRTAAIVIAVGNTLILSVRFVIATRYAVVCMFDPLTGQTRNTLYSTQFYLNNKNVLDFIDGIIFGIILSGMYVGGILVSTVVTVQKLRKMAEWRDQSTAMPGNVNINRDVTLTRMLIGNSCVFILCTTPPLILHTALPFAPELSLSGKLYNTYSVFLMLQQMLTYINASFNFFVYYTFGTKFRLSVQAMFCKGNSLMGPRNKETEIAAAAAPSSVTRVRIN